MAFFVETHNRNYSNYTDFVYPTNENNYVGSPPQNTSPTDKVAQHALNNNTEQPVPIETRKIYDINGMVKKEARRGTYKHLLALIPLITGIYLIIYPIVALKISADNEYGKYASRIAAFSEIKDILDTEKKARKCKKLDLSDSNPANKQILERMIFIMNEKCHMKNANLYLHMNAYYDQKNKKFDIEGFQKDFKLVY
ncbi:MAG: hypothetical protein Tsb0021_08130 [Chlamydiales bacterium]